MEYKFSSDLNWTKGESTHHKVDIDIELTLEDFIQGPNVAEQLALNEQAVRREVFETILSKIIPQIIEGTGEQWQLPDGDLSASTGSRWHGEFAIREPGIDGETLQIRDRITALIDIETSRPVNAIQAIYSDRGGLANTMTTSVMNALKSHFLGITKSSGKMSAKLQENEVAHYESRDKTDFAGN